MRSNGQVRVAVQFIHAATDVHLWAGSYQRDFRDVLTLQGEVARAVAGEIQVALTVEESPAWLAAVRSTPRSTRPTSRVCFTGTGFPQGIWIRIARRCRPDCHLAGEILSAARLADGPTEQPLVGPGSRRPALPGLAAPHEFSNVNTNKAGSENTQAVSARGETRMQRSRLLELARLHK